MTLLAPIHITLVNQSTVVSDVEVSSWATAINEQVRRDFAPAYGIPAVVNAAKKPLAGECAVFVLDNSDQAGALGYHDENSLGVPYGRVFAKTDLRYGLAPSVTASHEVLEMLADPFVKQLAQVNATTFTTWEVCDAVEADQDGYRIGPVLVSNFVTPAWFGETRGPYDFRKLLSKPVQLRPGGYMAVLKNGKWGQITARKVPGVTSRAEFAHRRLARAKFQAARHLDVTEAPAPRPE